MLSAILALALIAGLDLIPAGRLTAQTFTNLHNFKATSDPYYTNSDGAGPAGALTVLGNTLYGTALGGGTSDGGTLFKANTDGTGFTTLHSFTGVGEGTSPEGALVLSNNILYGTTFHGGSSNYGTVFRINTDGTGFTNLYSFPGGGTGADPWGGLILSGNTLYGTTEYGGNSDNGTVFKLNTDGTGFATVYRFTPSSVSQPYSNSDGANPFAGLILSGNTLYGTAYSGGSSGQGTIFKLNTDGTGFTTLHHFAGFPSDGANPEAPLILLGNTLYGTAGEGGTSAYGMVFKVGSDGTGFASLHSFTYSDGIQPRAGLIASGNMLYGTTLGGSTATGEGALFALNTDGTSFANLYSFTPRDPYSGINSDGAHPRAGLVLSGSTLYGTAYQGGHAGNGTVYRLSLPPPPPQLTIALSGSTRIVTSSAEPGRTYRLQYKKDWTAVNWTVLGGDVIATGTTVSFTDSNLFDPWRVYRVVLLP